MILEKGRKAEFRLKYKVNIGFQLFFYMQLKCQMQSLLLLGEHISCQEVLITLAIKKANGKFLWLTKNPFFKDSWKVSITERSEIYEEKKTLKGYYFYSGFHVFYFSLYRNKIEDFFLQRSMNHEIGTVPAHKCMFCPCCLKLK